MNRKIVATIVGVFLIGLVIVQLKEVNAQLADEPITGPITSPITSAITVTLTPTLISTVSTTPTSSVASISPTESPTPTPTLTPGTKLGGLNLASYCSSINQPEYQLNGGTWYCSNGSVAIDMNAACQWQYGMSNVVANQDIADNPWSWTCYVPPVPVSPTPTETPTASPTPSVSPTETPSLTPSETVTPTPSNEPENVSPTFTPAPSTSSVTPTCTPTPEQTAQTVSTHHYARSFFSTFHFPKVFPFIFTNSFFGSNHFFAQSSHVEVIHSKICTNHDKE